MGHPVDNVFLDLLSIWYLIIKEKCYYEYFWIKDTYTISGEIKLDGIMH